MGGKEYKIVEGEKYISRAVFVTSHSFTIIKVISKQTTTCCTLLL